MEAAKDIQKEFEDHRSWHLNVSCTWNEKSLKLVVENDFDENGQATLDEFGDCISAYIENYHDSTIVIESIDEL